MVWEGWRPSPLPASFMITAIIGLVVSSIWVLPRSYDWGVTFVIFFAIMFIASLVSLAKAPVSEY